MKGVPRRVPLLLLILVLLIAPVANAWCGTVCVAAAITSGCAHGLQPTDDLPVAKTVVSVGVAWVRASVSTAITAQVVAPLRVAPAQRTPLRL
jgi:hypothetical protein